MNKKILIVGLGNIGFRHLESFLLQKNNYLIDAVDNDVNKISSLKKKYINFSNKIFFFSNLAKIKKKYDLLIIATNSDQRFKVIKKIIKKITIKNIILEKFLFTNKKNFNLFEKILKTKKINTWVNCPLRTYSGFKFIKKKLKKQSFKMFVSGGNWNMCSNSIHYLDLFEYFTHDKIDLSLIKNNLEKKIRYSKRKGFIEFDGSLILKNNKNLLFIKHQKKIKYNEIIKIVSKNYIFICKFINKNLIVDMYYKQKKKKFIFEFPFQSEQTFLIANLIFKKKQCMLTNYFLSQKLHLFLLDVFLKHYQNISKKKYKFCPIT